MLVSQLQSWGKCPNCNTVIWIEPSIHEQKCYCLCGGLCLHDNLVIGNTDPSLTESELQNIINIEL